MVVIDERPLKRMKRRATAEMYDIRTFPAPDDEYSGAFRSNINIFLRKHARPSPPCELFQHVLIWQILFRIGELIDGQESSKDVVTLDVVEEDVARSKSVYCDQCRVVGWSGHPVCRKRYHFIIRKDSSINGHPRLCTNCGDLLHLSDPSCRSCNYTDPQQDVEKWVHLHLEDTSHLLHGVVHSNGYGHLLRVNGKEGGSEVLSGCDIMGFWDRLCTTLGVRKISVMDVSKKYGMEYRLLHGVTDGQPWYGKWGYEFATGSFALNWDAYQKAVNNLSGIPLSHFFQSRTPRTRLQDVITFYQSLSDCELTTIRDLFLFLMELIKNVHKLSQVVGLNNKAVASSWLCTWTKDDIESVETSMFKVLRAVGSSRWVSWRALKGAVRGMASAELVDHCLKELGGKSVGGMVVLSRCNNELETIEYRLVSCGVSITDARILTVMNSNRPTKEHVLRDIKFLYDSLLNPLTMLNYRPKAVCDAAAKSAMALLDCKQFVKVYRPDNAVKNPFALQLACQVQLLDLPKDFTAPPAELVFLPLTATITDFMTEATKAFREMYILFEKFHVEGLLGYEDVYSEAQLKCLVGTVGTVSANGRLDEVGGLETFRMERGTECWIVNCTCGAKDDDGERMLACDECSIWLHTRCAGINDLEPVPERFVCWRCCSSPKKANRTAVRQFGGKCSKTEASAKVNLKRGFAKVSPKLSETFTGKDRKMSAKQTPGRGKTKGILRLKKDGAKLARHTDSGVVCNKFNVDGHAVSRPGKAVSIKEESVVTFQFESGIDEKSPKRFLSKFGSSEECDEDGIVSSESSFKLGSVFSGTGSECIDETMAVADTCSSENALPRHSESGWKCKDESVNVLGTCKIESSLTVPFSVR